MFLSGLGIKGFYKVEELEAEKQEEEGKQEKREEEKKEKIMHLIYT